MKKILIGTRSKIKNIDSRKKTNKKNDTRFGNNRQTTGIANKSFSNNRRKNIDNGSYSGLKKVGRKKYSNDSIQEKMGPKIEDGLYHIDSLSSFKEYLRFSPRSIKGIKCSSKLYDKVCDLLTLFNQSELISKIKVLSNEDEEDLSFQAQVKVKTYDIKDLLQDSKNKQKDLVVVLDHISDPRNLGAIVRSSSFFGVGYIIIPEYRQAPITDTVVATSMGGLSLVKVVSVVNLAQSLKKLKDEGYWIVGTSMEGEDFRKVAGFYEKTVLVLGSEDKGMSQGVTSICDRNVTIPTSAEQKIDSLNVSVAGGILISEFSK